jgi:DNA-binding NarL/FixJ family response regulator
MSRTLLSAKEFDDFARLHCNKWEPRTLAVARASLVDAEHTKVIAERHRISTSYAITLRSRFLKSYANPSVKVGASSFMKEVLPDGLTALRPFRTQIQKLMASGYSRKQIGDYLRLNDVKVKTTVLSEFLKGLA